MYLTYNYRSAPVVLEHANQLIQCNPNRLSKPLEAVSDGSLSDLQLYQTDTPENEKNIIDIIKSDNLYKNYAILARTNNLIGKESKIEQALKSENIPYVIKSADSLYARPEVKDVIAYFDFLIDTKNDLAVERLLTRNVKLFGEASLKKLRSYAEIASVSIYEALSNIKNMSFGKLTNVLCTRLSNYYSVLTDYLNKCSDMKELTAVCDYILFKLSH
ncbi:3'-5' exonuclease [Candidatus Endomicrobiellum trichonymphae]|uniref:3'-5' exonuclease n=1 Tax=Endomicrobium trichonymphae TaxID=1408204 RepID=UPI000323E88D|nr:3'-5' exonuclease [Candidatus Endomicrobium trichonymphae]